MARRFVCPRGHTWMAELPQVSGDSTQVLPHCPACDEVGELAGERLHAPNPIIGEPTSFIAIEVPAFAKAPKQSHDAVGIPNLPGYDHFVEIGRGGMGVVYRAVDLKRGGQVAVKCLLQHDPNKLLRFKQEFRAVADLFHPNLVTVYELVQAGDHWCLVMELVDGVPFTDYFHRITDPGERMRLLRLALRQLVDGLCYLHDSGLLHCDVKPTNVLVTPQGRVVLLDFGLVTEWHPEAREAGRQELVGSLGYIAPERFAGKPPSAAGDWYSVGVMLFETFAGRRPFEGTRTNLIWQQRYMDPPLPSEIATGVPQGFDLLCVGLLQRDPTARLGRADLLHFLQEEAAPVGRLVTPRSRDVPLVGRDIPLLALEQALATIRAGNPVLVLLHGMTGMGKSALLNRFLERLVRRDEAVVLRGRCHEQESVPFKGLDGLIDALSLYLDEMNDEEFRHLLPEGMRSLGRMFPVMRRLPIGASQWKVPLPADPTELRQQATTALRSLITRLAQHTTLVIAIDDAQWIDADSARLVASILRTQLPPMLWIIASRREDELPDSPIAELTNLTSNSLQRIELELGPLTELESASLVQALLADQKTIDEGLATLIARESRGWPVFIHQLTDYAREQLKTSTTIESGVISLEAVIQTRMQQLPPASRQLLKLLAVAAQPVQQTTLFAAMGNSDGSRAALASLRVGHWIRTTERDGESLAECFHDSIREAVVRDLSEEHLTSCHDRLAAALMAFQPREHAWLAAHLLGAGRPDEAGQEYGRAASDAEETLAFDRAAQFLRLSLDLASWPAEEETHLRRRLADALSNAGHGAEAAQVYLEAARQGDGPAAARLRREAAFQYCASGHVDEGLATLRDALQTARLPIPPSGRRAILATVWERLRLRFRGNRFKLRLPRDIAVDELERVDLCWATTAGLSLFDVTGGAFYQARNLRLSLDLGEPRRLTRAFAWQAVHQSAIGNTAETWLQQAHQIQANDPHPYSLALVALAEGIVQFNQGRSSSSVEKLLEADEVLRNRCVGVTWERTVVQTFLAWALFQTGAFDHLAALADERFRLARDRGDRLAATNLAVFALPLARLVADDATTARNILHQHLQEWPPSSTHLPHVTAILTEARIDLYQGNPSAAQQKIESLLTNRRYHPFQRIRAIRVASLHLHGMLNARHDTRLALRSLAALEREQTPAARAFAALIRAAIKRDHLEFAPAAREAISQLRSADLHGYAAAATLIAGKRLNDPAMQLESEKWFREHHVVNPTALAEMLVPGWM